MASEKDLHETAVRTLFGAESLPGLADDAVHDPQVAATMYLAGRVDALIGLLAERLPAPRVTPPGDDDGVHPQDQDRLFSRSVPHLEGQADDA